MEILRLRRICALRVTIIVLFACIVTGLAHRCSSLLDGQLLIADQQSIWKLDTNGEHREVLFSTPDIIRLDYDYDKNSIYYSDTNNRQIFTLNNNFTDSRFAIDPQKQWIPYGFALDPITSKLYTADAYFGAVRVFDLQSDKQGIVIGTNLTHPLDMEVDPYERYLFVLDQYQILRTDLDGSNPEVIYLEFGNIDELLAPIPYPLKIHYQVNSKDRNYRKILNIPDIVLDTEAKRLYWIDTEKGSVESSNYQGKDRRIHFLDNNNSPRGVKFYGSLAYLNGSLYWADDAREKVIKINLNKDNESQVIMENIKPRASKAVSCASQHKVANPCATKQCQQLCLLSRSSEDNATCACSIGYELALDGKSCIEVQDFLIFTASKYIRGQSLRSDSKTLVDVINPSKFNVSSNTILEVNAKDGIIYYTSHSSNAYINQLRLSDGEITILQPDFLSKNVKLLAFDWTTGNLYYFTDYYADMTTLSVLNVYNPTYSKILIESVRGQIQDIVVHPNSGYVYFAQIIGKRNSINRLATDGSDLKELIAFEDDANVNGMAVDLKNDRIYWSESSPPTIDREWISHIKHSNLNGTDIKEIPLPSNLDGPTTLAIHDESIYVIGNVDQSIHRLDKRTGKDTGAMITSRKVSMDKSISGLGVFSRADQTVRPDHPCIDNKCQKFCFAVPKANYYGLEAVCGCPYGEKLDENGRDCVDNSQAEPPFEPCQQKYKCNISKIKV